MSADDKLPTEYLAYGIRKGDAALAKVDGSQIVVEVLGYTDDYFSVQCEGEVIKVYKGDIEI